MAAMAVLVLIGGFGLWRMDNLSERLSRQGEPVVVSLIQGNVRQDVKWSQEYQRDTLQKYTSLSLRAVKEGVSVMTASVSEEPRQNHGAPIREAALSALGRSLGEPGRDPSLGGWLPDVLVWPETCMPFVYGRSSHDAFLRAFSRDLRLPLIFGSLGAQNVAGEVILYNRASFLDARGNDAGKYDKEHLVPFGEYLPPVLDWKLFEPLLQGLGGFAPGKSNSLFEVESEGRPAFRMGMLICYEAIFPELARQRVADGAQLLLNISNDAWYDRTSAPVQHLQLSAMRAVEQGRYLARSTNTGITAFIDPLGGVHAPEAPDFALFTDTWLTGKVLALDGHTPYFYLHPWLPALSLFLLTVLCRKWAWRASRKRRI